MARLLKPIPRVCVRCGADFMALHATQRYCTAQCQREKTMEEVRSRKMKNQKKRAEPELSLDKILRDLKEYNRANNCYLSYGQYVSMLYQENKQ